MVRKATILTLPAWVFAAAIAHADEVSWCPPPTAWPSPSWGSPNVDHEGVLVRVGSRLIRSCTLSESPYGERRFRLTLDPQIIPFDYNAISLSSLVVSDFTRPEEWLANFLRRRIEIGIRNFGGIDYREYDHHSIPPQEQGFSSYFVFDRSLNPDSDTIPDHFIACPDQSPREGGAIMCFIFIPYFDLVANSMIVGDGVLSAPIQRDLFPSIATDVYRILRFSDFTDRQNEPGVQRLEVE